VGAGETVVRDLQVDAVLYVLPEVVVTSLATCRRSANAARIAALWEEARTALFASELSLRDELFRAHVTRYVRELEPRDARILSETRSEVSGVVSRPFTSVDPDSLSQRGYWWPEPDGSVTYYGPDAEVLLSDAFVRDHCFEERRQRDRRGMVGLGFRPLADRTLPDVVGTLWLDERTFELRFVEFTYSRTITNAAPSAHIGGEVHFARLASGAWIVRRWFIRLPFVGKPSAPLTTRRTTAPWVLVRPSNLQLREEGGEVAAEELVAGSSMASVTGVVRDSANRPWEGVRIRLAGSRLTTTSRATGAFTLDSVSHGTWQFIVEDPGYDTLGLAAAEARAEVQPNRATRVTLRALDTRGILGRLCPTVPIRRGTGALRLAIRTTGGDSLVSQLPLQVTWTPVGSRGRPLPPEFLQRATDDQGRVTLCGVPAGVELTILVARFSGGAGAPIRVIVPDRGVKGLVIRVEP
jgi:hypothetical protein